VQVEHNSMAASYGYIMFRV